MLEVCCSFLDVVGSDRFCFGRNVSVVWLHDDSALAEDPYCMA